MRRLTLLTSLLVAAVLAAPAQAQELVPFGGGPFDTPFYVAGEPGDASRVYVVEAEGQIHLVEDGIRNATPFLDINGDVLDVNETGCECGMFSMALPPDYASSGLFYVFYTQDDPTPGNQHFLVIEEFRRDAVNPDIRDPGYRREVLRINHFSASNHNGGQLQFGPDGLLYISTGDGGSTPQNGQSVNTLLGKLLRIDPEGAAPNQYSIPSDNPFVGVSGSDEVYSYGLRNPYRFSFDRLTGDLAVADVGQSEWEEIDFVSNGGGRGANFGWRCFEGPDVFTTSGECNPLPANHTPPVHSYLNPPGSGAAINGGYVVRDPNLPSLLGRYLYADSSGAFPEIRAVTLFPGGASGDCSTGMIAPGTVSFGEDAAGRVYVAQFGGQVSRIGPSSPPPGCPQQGAPPPAAGAGAGADTKGPALSVDARQARRSAERGELTVVLSCDEICAVRASGEIVLAGRDIGLDPDQETLPAGIKGTFHLDLSRAEARGLRRALARGRKAKGALDLVATDPLGNTGSLQPRIPQKR
jgi:glucose/arabinose dehydrogenase